jgi:hypothetical protein
MYIFQFDYNEKQTWITKYKQILLTMFTLLYKQIKICPILLLKLIYYITLRYICTRGEQIKLIGLPYENFASPINYIVTHCTIWPYFVTYCVNRCNLFLSFFVFILAKTRLLFGENCVSMMII